MRRSLPRLSFILTLAFLAGCAGGPPPPTPRLAPDGAKEFVLRLEQASFWPSAIYVNQGDRVRFIINSYYQFAQFSLPEFNVNKQIPHDAPGVVEFVASTRGWFDFYAYVSSPYYARLTSRRAFFDGFGAGSDYTVRGRLYVN